MNFSLKTSAFIWLCWCCNACVLSLVSWNNLQDDLQGSVEGIWWHKQNRVKLHQDNSLTRLQLKHKWKVIVSQKSLITVQQLEISTLYKADTISSLKQWRCVLWSDKLQFSIWQLDGQLFGGGAEVELFVRSWVQPLEIPFNSQGLL